MISSSISLSFLIGFKSKFSESRGNDARILLYFSFSFCNPILMSVFSEIFWFTPSKIDENYHRSNQLEKMALLLLVLCFYPVKTLSMQQPMSFLDFQCSAVFQILVWKSQFRPSLFQNSLLKRFLVIILPIFDINSHFLLLKYRKNTCFISLWFLGAAHNSCNWILDHDSWPSNNNK